VADLVRLVQQAGVVGAGGAGFPTHVKLGAQVEVVIINGAECEPLLRVDQQLLLREAEVLLRGLAAVVEHLRPRAVYLAVKTKHREILRTWEELLPPLDGRVWGLADFYPAGDEQVLVYEVTGRVVPPAGIPPEVGVLVMNVETLYNVSRALEGQPVTHKFVTVAGAVAAPKTVRVPVGIGYAELLALAGGPVVKEFVCLDGGPMMGRPVADLGLPVTKATKALVVLPSGSRAARRARTPWEAVLRRSRNACEICRMCTDLCPRYLLGHPLEVHRIMRAFAYGGERVAAEDHLAALLCVECGVCEHFACPVGIFPRTVAAEVKRRLLAAGVRYPRGRTGAGVRKYREGRRVPTGRLIRRLGLDPWDRPAPLDPVAVPATRVRVLLRPPFGAACRPVVEVGARVRPGDPVGEVPEGVLGARAHASIRGVVTAVTPDYVEITAQEA
jgi:Na+-translocating ferredoxin:NAD+ oxidoreductase RnfC subunit